VTEDDSSLQHVKPVCSNESSWEGYE